MEDAAELERPFNEVVVKKAIFMLVGDKALDPNDFLVVIFQRYWELFKGEIMEMMNGFFFF